MTNNSKTPCPQPTFKFTPLGKREIDVDFSGGFLSSDGGAFLLREAARRLNLFPELAKCFTDHRRQDLVEHTLPDLLAQRILGLALGYEDLNDHDSLRLDPLMASACDHRDILGQERRSEADKGKPLAGKSTLNRLELSAQEVGGDKKIEALPELIQALIVDKGVAAIPTGQPYLVLDFDNTDILIHGEQEGRFYHGYYEAYCYLPLYCFCGDVPLWAQLKQSDEDGSLGTVDALKVILPRLRARFGPDLPIIIRGDSGFCREDTMAFLETQPNVHHIFGIARNQRLETLLRPTFWSVAATLDAEATAAAQAAGTGKLPALKGTAREFAEFPYRTLKTWSRERRVIGKAEVTEGKVNPRFVVTSLTGQEPWQKACEELTTIQSLYEKLYCGRGNMENRIKEQQLDFFADRTSTEYMKSNQLRMWFSLFASILVREVRVTGLQGTEMAQATAGTIREKLFKLAAHVQVSVRRVYARMATAFPLRKLYELAHQRLMAPVPIPAAAAG
jgi:hypothetical protein